jgi:hypothetical protein
MIAGRSIRLVRHRKSEKLRAVCLIGTWVALNLRRRYRSSSPDDLIQRLQAVSHGDVSACIAGLVRNELDRQRLLAFAEEPEEELGPTDEAEVVEYTAAFARTAAITRAMEKEAEAETEAE